MGCGTSKSKSSPSESHTNNNSQHELSDKERKNEKNQEEDSESLKNPKENVLKDDTDNKNDSKTGTRGKVTNPPPAPPPPPIPPPSDGKRVDGKSKKVDDSSQASKTTDEDISPESKSVQQPSYVEKIMKGNLDADCPSVAKIVRIFVSSTFTDTRHERNWLMEKVYPKLKIFCQIQGYEFQVVDMRWGIRDEAQDDHMTTDMCLKEVDLCKAQSTGPCFVSLMAHKYGYRDFPREIEAEEFDKLIAGVNDETSKNLLRRWFQRDENAVPPTYVLQAISSLIPDAKSDVPDLKKAAMSDWNVKSARMYSALAQSARIHLDSTRANAYVRSVSEAEIIRALDESNKERYIWFRKTITDIGEVNVEQERETLRRFRDLSDDPQFDEESKQLLNRLEENIMPTMFPASSIFDYEIKWESKKGIDPDSNAQHREYLKKLCQDVEGHLTSLLREAFSHRDHVTLANPMFYEILQHTVFCKEKCKAFYGREDSLKQIREYLTGPSRHPLVIHGESGCGKTSLVAMAVKLAHELNGDNGLNIIRFIGTTPDSSSIVSLLSSVINQVRHAAGLPKGAFPTSTVKLLGLTLAQVSALAAKKYKVVILLDSLDQLDPSNNARHMEWLTPNLPVNVKMILSTLPEEKYEALPYLKAKLKESPEKFHDVPRLNDADITGILDKWLNAVGRTLTQSQRLTVLDTFKGCPLPLFLKLSFDEACKWKSYTPPAISVLQSTVRGCINNLFSRMETTHGQIFVSKALGYLTASVSGLSEAELEDILSCDEDVLGDVYRFWTPPIRRLPPLLLVRMKRDLGQYVVMRGADGRQVFYWYHRQFIEAAQDRYCSNEHKRLQLYEALANFFAGTWGEGNPKPYTGQNGEQLTADRHVSHQPVKFGSTYNNRKLTNLTFYRIKAKQLDKIKSECLLNFEFIMAKLRACGLRAVLDDFLSARKAFPKDEALEGVGEALQLSQKALVYDLATFSSQMLGRIRDNQILNLPEVKQFLMSCTSPDYMYLEPNHPVLDPSGGQLVHSIAEHSEEITALVLNKAGTVAITCDESGLLKIYDIAAAKVTRTVTGVGREANTLVLALGDSVVLVNPDAKLCAFEIETGVRLWSSHYNNAKGQFVAGGPNFSVVLMLQVRHYSFLDAATGRVIAEPVPLSDEIPGTVSFESGYLPFIGHEKYMVAVEKEQRGVFVFDPNLKSLSHYKKVLKSYKDEENDKVHGTVDGLQISLDGETLYMANFTDNNLHFVSTKTLEIIKVYPGCKHDFSDKYHISNDGKYLYFPNSQYVRVWDLQTGKKATVLHSPRTSSITDVCSNDMNTYVTINHDRTLKIWDLSRGDQPQMDFQDMSPDERVQSKSTTHSELLPLDNPRYYLHVRKDESRGRETRQQIFAIFDTSTGKHVCKASRYYKDVSGQLSFLKYLGNWTLAFENKQKFHLMDLRTMKVTKILQGKVPAYNGDLLSVNGGKELAHVSKGRMNLKFTNRETGKTITIIKAGQKSRIDTIIANKTGSVVLADCDGPLLVFNAARHSFEYQITPEMIGAPKGTDLYLSSAQITADGTYLLLDCDYRIPKTFLLPGVKQEAVSSVYVINLKTRKCENVLVDIEYYNVQKKLKLQDKEIYVDEYKILDDHRLVSSHDDHIVRIWDFKTGKLLHRLKKHHSYASLPVTENYNILLTNGTWDEEYAFRLWDVKTFQCLAVYRYDTELRELQMIGPKSCSVVGFTKFEAMPVIFHVKGQGAEDLKKKSVPESNFPNILKAKEEMMTLDLSHPDEDTIDDDDPDSDEEEQDEDDDDDEDDDPLSESTISDNDNWE